MDIRFSLPVLIPCLVTLTTLAAEKVGRRPYEMVWAGRTQDDHRPLVDFEKLDGWKVQAQDAHATFARSREQQLWGKHVGKLVYRGTSRRAAVTLRPPKPIRIPGEFDCINFWVYGNNWAWAPDRTTPRVLISVLLRSADGKETAIPMARVRWKEWWVMHVKLQPPQLTALAGGAAVAGVRISGGYNEADRVLFFDNLSVYKEDLKPLKFPPRRKRGIELFVGQSAGLNTGPGRLPFPTREQTLLPDNLTDKFQVRLREEGGACVFEYRGDDGTLEYRYEPKTGTLGDVSVRWGDGEALRPMKEGGVRIADGGRSVAPDSAKLLSRKRQGDVVVTRWRVQSGKHQAEVAYTLRLLQKSLVIDVRCLGGQVAEFVIGRAGGSGVKDPRLVTLPYLVGDAARPAVLVMGKPNAPLFLTGLMDYTRSNASRLTFVNRIDKEGVAYNGGSQYSPRTDGKRNDCFERLFLTVSPRFEEVLPNIPNPKSPWMHVTGERLWRAHGASNRERDLATWAEIARYGMTKVVITDHETGWRDGGESFTFRTKAAPGKGGDKGQADYARKIRALGFVYGIYNNYTDFAPVNEHWGEDMVSRLPDGQWRTAWARCYNPKPARAVEYEAKLAPIIQRKFKLSTAYCDVHTAVTPWGYVDFDARVPGAATFAQTFYAYGEIMLHQKATWEGPVYSEGNNHYYYCGLTDGNYAQDQRYNPAANPWLVDFDLRKIHPLCCNFGMGNLGMFYGRRAQPTGTQEQRDARLDHFLAATVAFGHTGFLVRAGGMRATVRSYYMLQQLHKAYAGQKVKEIRYANVAGNLLDTSAAVATGAFRRNQIKTTYADGLEVWVNGHECLFWPFSLGLASFPAGNWRDWVNVAGMIPPGGYAARSADCKLQVFSGLRDGDRADYVDSPAYIYCDGRGRPQRFPKAACDRAMIALKRDDGKVELIGVGGPKSLGVGLAGCQATAVALDKDRKPVGPAETRFSRGLVHVVPVKGAFSYLLTPTAKPKLALGCDRDQVIPGQTVTVHGRQEHTFHIPADAKPGEVLWRQAEGQWLDFPVRPLVDMTLSVDGAELEVRLRTNLPKPSPATVEIMGSPRKVNLVPERWPAVRAAIPRGEGEFVRPIDVLVRAGALSTSRRWWLKAEREIARLAGLSEKFQAGQCYRGRKEEPLDGASGTGVSPRSEMSCGNRVKGGLFMHPPWKGGVGYAYALFEPTELPAGVPGVLRCSIGKGDGSDIGDGILFRVAVVDEKGAEKVIAERQWARHAWGGLAADLSPWAGKTVRIKLITDVGPADNSSGDWACWADCRIESKQRVMNVTVHDRAVKLRYERAANPVPGLRAEDLRKARKGWLCLEGQGIENGEPYISYVKLNGLAAGRLPQSAGADETRNRWSPTLRLKLPENAIRSLAAINRLAIDNPGGDCFKIRRIRIELELADGRKCSSRIETTIYSQPPGWLHAEGTAIEAGRPIETEVRFDLSG